jgi:AcrR family transcriptional regulator
MKEGDVVKKKELLAEFNRNNILKAAQHLFEKKGVVQTTVDDIAKEADYSKSTIYVYFKSKEDIYNHIVLRSMHLLKENLRLAIDHHSNCEEKFYAICNTIVKYQEEAPLYFESLLGKIVTSKEERENNQVLEDIYQVGNEINLIIEEVLELGKQNGIFREDIQNFTVVFTLWASISGVVLMASRKENYIEEESQKRKMEFLQESFGLLLSSIKKER